MASTRGFQPGPHWWGASALTTAPPLLPHIGIEEIILLSSGGGGGEFIFHSVPHPLRMFFTACLISLILQQYTSGFIKELT